MVWLCARAGGGGGGGVHGRTNDGKDGSGNSLIVAPAQLSCQQGHLHRYQAHDPLFLWDRQTVVRRTVVSRSTCIAVRQKDCFQTERWL